MISTGDFKRNLRIQIDGSGPSDGAVDPPVVLPVSIVEVGLSGIPVPASPATIDTGCRDDLVTVDGQPFPVEIRGASRDARRGLDLVACDAALPLLHSRMTWSSRVPTAFRKAAVWVKERSKGSVRGNTAVAVFS